MVFKITLVRRDTTVFSTFLRITWDVFRCKFFNKRIRMVLKATVKSFVMGFGYFANWRNIKVIAYSMVRHIVRHFGYGS